MINTNMAGVTLLGNDDGMMHVVGNSRITVTSNTNSKMVFNTNTALVLTKDIDFTMKKKTDMFGTFEVQPSAKVNIDGSLYLKPQTLTVEALTIGRSGSVTVPTETSSDILTINATDITFNGNLTAGVVKLDNLQRFAVGEYAFVTFEPTSHNLLLGSVIDIQGNVNLTKIISFRRPFCEHLTIDGGSLVMEGGNSMTLQCKDVHINGLLSIQCPVSVASGFDSFTVGPLGQFTFRLDGDFICDTILVNGTMTSMTNISMRGQIRDNIENFGIGSAGRLTLDSINQKSGLLAKSSTVAAHIVKIDGTFLPGQLHIPSEGNQGGWDSIEIGAGGSMQFQPDGDFLCNYMNINGTLESYAPITVHGHNVQLQMFVGIGGSVLFDSNSSHPLGPWRGTSSIQASTLTTEENSAMTAGYITLAIDDIDVDGRLTFEAASMVLTNTFVVGGNGHVETASPIAVKSPTVIRTSNITVNGYMKLDTRGKHDTREWSSSNASVLHVSSLVVGSGGSFLAGHLSLAEKVETLTVGGNGKFEFEPATLFHIISTEIAGQVKSYIPMSDGIHLKGELLNIKSSGKLDMDYNGDVNDSDSGCLPSYIQIVTCDIAGTVQAGSLSIDTSNISVATTGNLIVNYGGYESGNGPGKNIYIS